MLFLDLFWLMMTNIKIIIIIVLWSSILSNKFGYIMLDKPFFFQSMEIQIPILLQIEINSI